MRAQGLAAIALRVWGVVFLVGALASVPQTVVMFTSRSTSQPDWLAAQALALWLSLGVRALAGVALIALADRIAVALVRDNGRVVIGGDPGDLMALGLLLTGVFFLVWGVQDVAVVAYLAATLPRLAGESMMASLGRDQRVTTVRAAVEVVAGLILIFRRGELARAWQRVRGRDADDEPDDGE